MTAPWEPDTDGPEQEPEVESDAESAEPEAKQQEPDVAELEDRWRRALADLDNLRKRHARELERVRAEERASVTAAWLPLIDNLELALEHAEADPRSVLDGVRAIREQAVNLLAQLGYPRRDEVGVPFDPNQHEVVNVVETPDADPGTVIRVLRPGYGDADKQLRPVAVAVSRKPG
ncbi:nucleotide exchange factor GrpE [Saccharopolyspora phatthalungensis]|uniref:Protein GrpE n=1 Tax=Saccharopolyspora phatthalungensis TaxID=664693 RepID=A0A840QIN1_9PSEU|nr:nucleotide exchange factor GrpE [Saccharopolyspora phatthalungensis]MBB5158609.1 molecular chaperone GrpE [Saccharopolyspora phatthalungensis]